MDSERSVEAINRLGSFLQGVPIPNVLQKNLEAPA